MASELKKIIREAFNTAYSRHKSKILSETVDSLKAKMSSGDINKTENAFREILEKPNLALNYAWSPQGSANGKLNVSQFNLLAEMIFEKTDMNTKRNLIMSLYNQGNKALYNKAAKRIMSSLNVVVNEKTMEQAYMEGWAQMFLDTESKLKPGEIKQNFADIVSKYSGAPVVDKKTGKLKDSNFGAYIAEVITSNILNAYKTEMSREGGMTSLDAPSPITGKATEFGSDEDFGSDTLNQMIDPSADLAGLGAGLEDSEETDISSGEYVSAAGDEEESDIENVSADQTIGSNISASDKEERKVQDLIDKMILSLDEAIDDMGKYMPNATDNQKEALALLKKTIETGESNTDEANKINSALKKGKFGKIFTNTVNRYFLENGFTNPEGYPMDWEELGIVSLAKLIKLKKNNYARIEEVQLDENLNWLLEAVILKEFMDKNLDKIMENVYKRLLPKLNN